MTTAMTMGRRFVAMAITITHPMPALLMATMVLPGSMGVSSLVPVAGSVVDTATAATDIVVDTATVVA
jgi:hypothetical protein